MKIKMIDSCGRPAWYRKQGIYCFDFVTNIKHATSLTAEEASRIMDGKDFYLNFYGACALEIEEDVA